MATDESCLLDMDSAPDVQQEEGGIVQDIGTDFDISSKMFEKWIMKGVTCSYHRTAMLVLDLVEKITGMLVGEKNRLVPQTDWKRAMDQEMAQTTRD